MDYAWVIDNRAISTRLINKAGFKVSQVNTGHGLGFAVVARIAGQRASSKYVLTVVGGQSLATGSYGEPGMPGWSVDVVYYLHRKSC